VPRHGMKIKKCPDPSTIQQLPINPEEAKNLFVLMTLIVLNEVQGLFLRDDVNTAHTIFMCYPVHSICNFHQLRSEGSCDELSGSRIGLTLDHVCTRG
jgi:hypothetical protein